jgi:hypothetical protein
MLAFKHPVWGCDVGDLTEAAADLYAKHLIAGLITPCLSYRVACGFGMMNQAKT